MTRNLGEMCTQTGLCGKDHPAPTNPSRQPTDVCKIVHGSNADQATNPPLTLKTSSGSVCSFTQSAAPLTLGSLLMGLLTERNASAKKINANPLSRKELVRTLALRPCAFAF